VDITNPNTFLAEMRKLAAKVTDAADAQKSVDGVSAVRVCRMFQDLDQWLCEGGDAPSQWAGEEE
jgi:hypothetical protein